MTAVSCNSSNSNTDNTDNSNTQNTGNNADTTEAATAPDVISVLASLPNADYGGYNFRILTSNWFNANLEARQAPDEQQTGDIINDALYIRDKQVEAKYNINISYNIIDYDVNQILSNAQKSIKAGDDAFDFGMDNMITFTKGLAQNGMLVDFNTISNVDLTQSWWSKYAIRDLTINGKFYFATGDITARYPDSQYILLFNKKVFADEGLDLPYQTVRDGNWTLDTFTNLIKDKSRDLNGDGVLDKNDFYGLAVETSAPFCFLQACGEGLIKIVDGNPTINVTNDRTVNIMGQLASFWTDPQYMYYPKNYVVYDEVPIFKNDQTLFVAQTCSNLSLFKDMNSDFGILPLPKYDTNQTEYYSYCQPYASASVCVPVTNTNLDRTGTIIEALAAAGKYTSTPAVYDVTLKTKYARDEDSAAMLDIIVAGSCYDFSFIYDWGGLYSTFESTMDSGQNFTSKFDAISAKVQAAIDKTVTAYAAQ